MITISITYPQSEGASFNWDYFADSHLPAVGHALKPFGLTFAAVLQGLEAVPSGEPPYVAMVLLTFSDDQAGKNALASESAQQLMADIANFTTIQPVVQLNRMVP